MPTAAILRKARACNARSLLCSQSKLIILERRLREQEAKDNTNKKGQYKSSIRQFNWLGSSANIGGEQLRDSNKKQLDLTMKIGEVFKEYWKNPHHSAWAKL
jgi:hypothetical protein